MQRSEISTLLNIFQILSSNISINKVLNKFKKDSIELYRLNVIIQDGEHKIDERAHNRKMFNELQQYIESEKNISLNYLDERQGIQYSRKRESREEI